MVHDDDERALRQAYRVVELCEVSRNERRVRKTIGAQERVARILDISGLTKSDLMRVERQPKS